MRFSTSSTVDLQVSTFVCGRLLPVNDGGTDASVTLLVTKKADRFNVNAMTDDPKKKGNGRFILYNVVVLQQHTTFSYAHSHNCSRSSRSFPSSNRMSPS